MGYLLYCGQTGLVRRAAVTGLSGAEQVTLTLSQRRSGQRLITAVITTQGRLIVLDVSPVAGVKQMGKTLLTKTTFLSIL